MHDPDADARRLARGGVRRADVLGPATLTLVLLAICAVVTMRRPYLWYDELVTRVLVRDPSVAHMVRTIALGGENNPPLYELLLRGWCALFGTSSLALRLPSGLFVAGAGALLWRVLRRSFTAGVTAAAIATLLLSDAVLDQVAQARFYGLFLFAAAAAIACAVAAARDERPGMAQALVTAAAHVLLLYAHTFGIVYSAAIGIALLLDDVRRGRRRWAPYLAIASAWLLFAPWIAFLLEQARMAQPNAWFPVPSLRRFTGVMERLTSSLSYAAIVAAAALLLGRWRRREPEGRADSGVVFLVLLGTAVVLVAPVVFLESRLAKPVFVDRYVLPSALGFPLLVAPALDVIGRRLAWRRWRPALWVLFATLCIASVVRGARTDRQQRPMITAASEGAHGLPVVVESAFEFVELDQYREPGERYLYPLDWRLAVDGSSAPGSVQEYKLMALWRNAGYVGAEVADGAAILCRTPRFLVLESAGRPWFERRVRADSLWTISGTDATRDTRRLWLVSRRGPLPECTASEALPSVHPSVARAPQH